MRVVLDTNVLISALVFPGGSPESVYRLVTEGRVEMVSSPSLLAELARVLGSKFGWAPDDVAFTLRWITVIGVIVWPVAQVDAIVEVPDDDRVLEAAAEGHADAIVSGDRHLMNLGAWNDIPILSPAAFLDRVRTES